MTGIYLNFYSFGIFSAFIFTLLLALHLLTIKDKSMSTTHLGVGFLFLTFFIIGYFWACISIDSASAFHRYVTSAFVFPSIIHFGQWVIFFPDNKNKKIAKFILISGYAIALITELYFIISTVHREKMFIVNAHHWDLESSGESKILAIIILLFSIVNFVFVPLWKVYQIEKIYKKVIIKMSLGMLIASLVPNITNVLSRDGLIQREWYLWSLVVMFVPGFLYIALVYLNNTNDKTNITAKITGTTLVSFILILQWINFYIHSNAEKNLIEKCKFDTRMSMAGEPIGESIFQIDYQPVQGNYELDKLVFNKMRETLPYSGCLNEINSAIYLSRITYEYYRKHIHEVYKSFHILLLLVLLFALSVYYFMIRTTIITPILLLVKTMQKVRSGERNLQISIKGKDEIGFLSESFNSMMGKIVESEKAIHEYTTKLEEKINERTREISDNLEKIQKLKIQQDGDYYLTSLLLKPMVLNNNNSEKVKTEIFIQQKKQVEFRGKTAQLGGDFCLTETIYILNEKREMDKYILAVNADAMGKSMQGASGALVLAVLLHTVLGRDGVKYPKVSPEVLLENIYNEINETFSSFNGLMTVSCILALIKESDGMVMYINSEHPAPILLRDGIAGIPAEDQITRKIGYKDREVLLNFLFLLPGDMLFLASDGRDDILLSDLSINYDENLFLNVVKESKGELALLVKILKQQGEITDDLSLIKIEYHGVKSKLEELMASKFAIH